MIYVPMYRNDLIDDEQIFVQNMLEDNLVNKANLVHNFSY